MRKRNRLSLKAFSREYRFAFRSAFHKQQTTCLQRHSIIGPIDLPVVLALFTLSNARPKQNTWPAKGAALAPTEVRASFGQGLDEAICRKDSRRGANIRTPVASNRNAAALFGPCVRLGGALRLSSNNFCGRPDKQGQHSELADRRQRARH